MTARLVIAGTHSGVGKTTVATGLMAAMAATGRRVAGFKVGPDFIDPSYHQLATGRPARNLDAFLSGPELVAPLFAHGAAGADVAVVEGVMGLFDGRSGQGELASTAHVAKLLAAPVVLVVDASALARSVVALVHGYTTFDPAVRVAGVICNRVGSPGHAQLLREALQPLGVPVLGILHRQDDLETPSRHLGLVPVAERPGEARLAVERLGDRIAASCDLPALIALARSAPALTVHPWEPPQVAGRARIAVAAGKAFTFMYTENLELLRAAGAELVELDPTTETGLPAGTGALYLGGGFPEAYAGALSANAPLRRAVAAFAEAGRPVVAECGGLLYLCERLDDLPMCGVLPVTAAMSDRLSLGYRDAVATTSSPPWRAGEQVRGHEFHYSRVTAPGDAWDFGTRREGFAVRGVHASYLHTHWAATPQVAPRLVAAAAAQRSAA